MEENNAVVDRTATKIRGLEGSGKSRDYNSVVLREDDPQWTDGVIKAGTIARV